MSTSTKPPASTDILTPAEVASANGAANYAFKTGSDITGSISKTASDGAKATGDLFADFNKTWKEKGFFAALGDGFSGLWTGLLGLFGMSGDPTKDKNGLNVGSTIGFMGGGLLGWMIGQAFGGGYIGMAFGAAAAACGAIIGSQKGDQYLNPIFNRPVRGTRESNAQAQAQTVSQQPQQTVATQQATGTGIDFNTLPAVQAELQAAAQPALYDGQFYQQYRNTVAPAPLNPTSSQVAGLGSYASPQTPYNAAPQLQLAQRPG